MKTTEKVRRACDNCKYFSLRYFRAKYTYLVSMESGKCFMRNFTEEEREKLPYGFVCDMWERKECAVTDLSLITYELGEIAAKLILIVKELSK